jgi:hypothetical protein
MDNPAFVLFSAVSPILVALVKQSGWSRQTNALVALAAYVIVGVLGAATSGLPLTIENVVPLVSTATVVGTAAYQLVWRNLGASTDTDPSIEDRIVDATSIVRSPEL